MQLFRPAAPFALTLLSEFLADRRRPFPLLLLLPGLDRLGKFGMPPRRLLPGERLAPAPVTGDGLRGEFMDRGLALACAVERSHQPVPLLRPFGQLPFIARFGSRK